MAFTDIQDNSIITFEKLKQALKIDDDVAEVLDWLINLHLAASKEAADNYCQDSFDPVPAGIELWILQIATLWWERVLPMVKAQQFQDLGQVNWQFDYDDYYHLLKNYRNEVGFA